MNETQKRIKAYQAMLPGLKERVLAVALLLVVSLTMMTSATFAWLTISRAPEVTGVSTTVAANGNLEVALVGPDGARPGESQVGDSSAAQGQSVTAANLTWGNLINLTDPSYGLDNLTLRPAQLNTASLLDSPLYGAVYKGDGRIEQLSTSFGYTVWNLPEGNTPGYFGVSENYGVRAISSTKVEAVGAEALYHNMVTAAVNKNLAAISLYTSLGSNSKYMPSLATMMGLYMTARMNPSHETLSNPTCNIADIQNLRDMYAAFLDVFDAEADAMAALANLSLFLKHGDGNYTPYTAEKIYATTSAKLKAEGIQITNLEQFIADRNIIASDLEKLKALASSGTSLAWKDSGLNNIVNNLVNVGACTIGKDNTPISSIGASNALGYLSGTQEARITNGVLLRFEERIGGYIEVKNLGISATVSREILGRPVTVPATVKANIQTTASRDYNLFGNDLAFAESLNDGTYEGGIPVAEDTYGLAIDLWVRTNASGSYLTLEGNVLTETELVRATGTDANGNTVELYTLTLSGAGEEGSLSLDVYPVTAEDGSVTWYNAANNSIVSQEEMGGAQPVAKMEEIVTVIGFQGENRVWSGDEFLSTDATTQGSGSCYVYYADTPEDQARSLKLLEAFNVAFVDEAGKLMATAVMDTEHFFAENGRVIVPLVLSSSGSINLGEDLEGNSIYAITALEKNTPTRITAIVYLDGTELTNDQVLSAADIQGQLNIQFGSSQDLHPIEDEALAGKERRVSASVSKSEFDYDTATEPMKITVTVNVDGDEPSTVTAFFLRQISATQGSREEVMTFTKNAGGDWVSDYTFTVPGNYILRSVQLDGVDYPLSEPAAVKVNGFTIASLSCAQADENNHVSIMTAANSHSMDLRLKFATNDVTKMPTTVQGRFLREDGSATNVNFTYNATAGAWTGTATFLTSGDYTMQYVVLDGEYVELDPAFWQTAKMVLGMKVAVYTTSPHDIKYIPDELKDNEKLLGMQVVIMDNNDDPMPGLSGVKLTYGMKGSGTRTMDADLVWDGSYYVGAMQNAGPGIWQFRSVTVGSNTLTNATDYPTFTIMSPEPPEYYDHNTVAYQYTPENNAKMNVQLTNSAAAAVQAYIIKDDEAEGVWVDGKIGGDFTTSDGKSANHWNFIVPGDVDGYQDGNWTLTQLKLWNVFDTDGTEYTEEHPLVIDVPANANNKTKVVCRVYPVFTENKSKNFGKDGDNVTGTFMQTHTISGLSMDIVDFEGQLVSGVTDVQLTFTYVNGTSATNGGYTSNSLNNATEGATIRVTLSDAASPGRFEQTESATILYAGNYTTTLSFKVNGTPVTYSGDMLPANAPVFTVWSAKPTVTIDSINPEGSHDTLNMTTEQQETVTSKVDGFTVEIYSESHKSGNNAVLDTYPQVTLSINKGAATKATLTFSEANGNEVKLYAGERSSQTDSFVWESSTTCKRYVGYFQNRGLCSSVRLEGAGTLKASVLLLEYDGVTYTVEIPEITIKNIR